MYELLDMGYLVYELEDGYILVGELRKECNENHRITYVFDIDEKAEKYLEDHGESTRFKNYIPGIDLEKGYVQRHDRVPFFIKMRTPDRRRPDIQERLDYYGLEYYDQFKILLRNRGNSLDKWRVLESLK